MPPESSLLTIVLLVGGILPLAIGPFLAQWAERSKATKAALDAFIAVSLGGVVILHLWPHAFLVAGGWALAGGLAGMLLPFLLHGSLHSQERKIYPAMVTFAFLGLAIHATLDGVALLSPVLAESGQAQEHVGHHGPAHEAPDDEHDHGEASHGSEEHGAEDHGTEVATPHDHAQQSAALLALAVILHRLPMGVAVWWLAVPILGRRAAILLLGILIGATVLGFTIAGRVLVDFSMPGIAIFEATIAGMLLHVIMGHEHGHGAHKHSHGVHKHSHGAHAHGHDLGHEAHELAPALDPPVGEENPWISALGALAGGALVGGLCLVHPMEQRFAEELSFGEAFTTLSIHLAPLFLLGAVLETILQGGFRVRRSIRSEIALPTVLVAFGLLGWKWTLLYLAGVAWMLLIGLRSAGLHATEFSGASSGPGSGYSLRNLSTRFEQIIHADGVWAWVGIGTTALLEPILRIRLSGAVPDWLSPGFALVAAALLGAICCRNALFGVVLAFFLLHTGWSHEAVLSFLLTGVAARVVRGLSVPAKPVIFTCLGFVPLIWAAGLIPAGAGVDFHRLAAKDDVVWQLAALAVLTLMMVAGLFSRGFRGFLQPVFGVPAESPEEARIDQEETTPLEPALGSEPL